MTEYYRLPIESGHEEEKKIHLNLAGTCDANEMTKNY